MLTITNTVRLLTPLVVGFLAGWMCPVKDAGADIPARPPGYVFGIVWFILYILIGVAWVYAARVSRIYDVAFAALVILLALWLYFYGCKGNEKTALYIILLSFLTALMITVGLASDGNRTSLYLVPLLVWLMFATLMNYTIVNTIVN